VPYFKPGKELKELINGKSLGDEPDDDIDDDDDFDDAPDAVANDANGAIVVS
jgi:hypothetical protein